jgi:hypothetical protein
MVLDHVPQNPRLVKVRGPCSHSLRFRGAYLYEFYVVVVPERIEQGICKSEHQDVPYCFLAQIMVIAENVCLFKIFRELIVQFMGRLIIGTERLFDDDQSFGTETFFNQLFRGGGIDLRRQRKKNNDP